MIVERVTQRSKEILRLMLKNNRYYFTKSSKTCLRHIVVFPLLMKNRNKTLVNISVRLPKLDVKKLDQKELRMAKILSEKLYKYGYYSDLETLALFVLGKDERAFTSIKKFISFCKNTYNNVSHKRIRDYIASRHFLGVGKQSDGSIVLELFSKRNNMSSCCVYSLINVILTNIFQHVTYSATKKGLTIIMDNAGYNVRLWQDRKLFCLFKLLKCTFRLRAIINVDTSKRFSQLFLGFLCFVKLADITFMVRRSDDLRANIFEKCIWSKDIWYREQLPEIYSKFPNLKLSAHFSGNNRNLLTLFTIEENVPKGLLIFRKGDLKSTKYDNNSIQFGSKADITRRTSIKDSKVYKDCTNCESNIQQIISESNTIFVCIAPMLPLIELSPISEFSSSGF